MEKYDVIIIGAGIGGLVCGCYLTKAGLKVLIIEQHSRVGGYCASFSRKGYRFDAAVHYIGGIKTGIMAKILDELEAKNEIRFNQIDPTDKIIIPGICTYVRANPYDTIKEFKKSFPSDKKSIEGFFELIMQSNMLVIYKKVQNLNFGQLLNSFFTNEKIKSAIGILLLGNIGLPPSEVSAFASIVLFKEFLLDPGYYPLGGMQGLADYFLDKFKRYGGEIILSRKAEKLVLDGNTAKGIIINRNVRIQAKVVISNIDATQTFKNLIEVDTKESVTVDQLIPSNSIFAVYLGAKASFKNIINEICNVWFFPRDNIEECYKFLKQNIIKKNIPGIMLSFPSFRDLSLKGSNKYTIQIFTMAPFETSKFWEKNRDFITERMLCLAEEVLPGIKKQIEFQTDATPYTFYKYTLNREGAAYGWASFTNQVDSSLLPQKTSIRNLFLVGHWCTMGAGQGGISTVAFSGKKAAESIVKLFKNNLEK